MMELESLLREITSLTPTAIGIVLFAGLVVGVAPSSFPLLSVAAGFVGGQEVDPKHQQRFQGLVLSLGFVLGIALVDALIGVFFGYAGFLVMNFGPVPALRLPADHGNAHLDRPDFATGYPLTVSGAAAIATRYEKFFHRIRSRNSLWPVYLPSLYAVAVAGADGGRG